MPLIAWGVGAYAAGLIAGLTAHVFAAVSVASVVALFALHRRSIAHAAVACLVIAGYAIGVERRWRDAECVRTLAAADTVRAVLVADAERGSLARGRTREPGCAIRVAVAVRSGSAVAGATVAIAGRSYASGDGLLIRNGALAIEEGPGLLPRIRARASRALQRDFGDDAPLAKALLIAETADLGSEVRDRFATAGLVHILSISGLHVTIVATAMLLLLQAARVPTAVALASGCALTAFYVALIGAPPPAVRSAVMFAALAASRLIQRPTSPWSALALGALFPLPADPRVVLDIGWQLTVAGMVAIIAAGRIKKRYIATRWTGWRQYLARELVTGVLASVVTAPLVAWYFGRTSVVAPLANIFANPVASVLQPTLFLALALGWWPEASGWVADAARPGLRALDGVATAAASLPGADFGVAPTFAGVVLACIAVAAVLVAMLARRPLRPLTWCAAAFAGLLWLPFVPSGSGELELHAIDVGQGDALALRTPRGRWVLVDAGRAWDGGDAGRRAVVPYIRRRGGDVALFVLSHPDADHVGGAASVLEMLRPREYWDPAFAGVGDPYRASLAAAARRGVAWRRAQTGDSLGLDGVLVRVLAPDSAWTARQRDPNEASIVLMVEYGAVRMLLTGDAEVAQERWLVSRWGAAGLRADVLKAGHHGSRTSSTPVFLDAVQPRLAVISVGAGNTYRHPSAQVLDAFTERDALVLRTDELGSVVVSTDGRRIRVAGGDGRWVVPPPRASPPATAGVILGYAQQQADIGRHD